MPFNYRAIFIPKKTATSESRCNLIFQNQARPARMSHALLQAHSLETRIEYACWRGGLKICCAIDEAN
jgi:hypothetical protein